MPDLLAGTTILAQDWPETQHTRDLTTITGQGVGDTDYETLDPEVAVTFIAPTTGRVEVEVWAGLRVSAGTDRAQADFQIRENDASGAIVRNGSINALFGTEGGSTSYAYGSGQTMVDGLTPGATYFARVLTRATSAATEYDVSARAILVKPLS